MFTNHLKLITSIKRVRKILLHPKLYVYLLKFIYLSLQVKLFL